MAIFKQIVQVNGGNTGWTRQNILTSLEEVFANLGWHSGSAKTGLVKTITPPYVNANDTPGWYNQLSPIGGIAKNDKTWTVTNSTANVYTFAQTAGSGSQSGNNIDITCNQGDILTFNITTPNDPFYIVWVNTNGYEPGTEIDGDYSLFPRSSEMEGKIVLGTYNIRNIPSAQGVTNGTITWDTNNVLNGTYYYVCGDNAQMKGKITINPNISYAGNVDLYSLKGSMYNQWYTVYPHRVYYEYTVPASGGRSAATFRVYRNNNGRISDIEILNAPDTFGWSEGQVFTIPGNQIGGTTPANDITFGSTLSQTTPKLSVQTLGAGTEFYHKNLSEGWGVLRLINDTNKVYGKTFWSFQITPDRFNQLVFNSGVEWVWSNTRVPYTYNNSTGPGSSTNSANDSNHYQFNGPGHFGGLIGIDKSVDYAGISTDNIGIGYRYIQYCRNTNPTSYPISIRVYKAQSPQDSNFAIIQFTQTVNEVVETYGTFFLHKGTGHGNGIWDLNNTFQGGMTVIESETSNGQKININTAGTMGINSGYYYGPLANNEEAYRDRRRTREALYGYERDTYYVAYNGTDNKYLNNISTSVDEDTSTANYNPANTIYFREVTRDSLGSGDAARPGAYQLTSSINYYRVIKGIPLCSSWVPQPYYLPDDFTIIQFAFGPGETNVRTGDTITISPSEKYEVVNSSFNINVSVGGVGPSTQGIALCARIV